MIDNKKKQLLGLFVASLVAALILAGLRCVMTLLCLDVQYGVYQSGAIMPTIFNILTPVFCAAVAIFGFRLAREIPCPLLPEPDSFVVFSSSVTAFLMAASSLYSVYRFVTSSLTVDKLTVAKIIVSIPAVIWYLSICKPKAQKTPPIAFLSFFPIVWFALDIVGVYFDKTLLITSPAKTLRQMAILAVMIYLLCESREIIGRANGFLFLIISSVAPILIITSSLPALIFSGKLMIGESDDFLSYSVELAMSLFILARLLSFAKSPSTLPRPEKRPSESAKKKRK